MDGLGNLRIRSTDIPQLLDGLVGDPMRVHRQHADDSNRLRYAAVAGAESRTDRKSGLRLIVR